MLSENKKAEQHVDDGDTSCNWRNWNGPNGLDELEIAQAKTI